TGEESGPPAMQSAGGGSEFDPDLFTNLLLQSLAALASEALRTAARQAVSHLAGMEPGRPVGGTYYLYRTLRRLDMARLEADLLQMLRTAEELSEFDERLLREEVEERLNLLRSEIEEEIRRRLVD